MLARLNIFAFVFALTATLQAQTPPPATAVHFQNVRIFDGKGGDALCAVERAGARQQDRAHLVNADPCRPPCRHVLIDGGGRTLMPGLIDAHWHAMLMRADARRRHSVTSATTISWPATRRPTRLMRGFTTVRDVGGPVVRSQARHRRRHRHGPAHLSVRRHDHRHERARGFPPADRSAADDRRHAHPHGADSAAAWSRTAPTRCACACANSSCRAPPRSS